MNTLYKHITFLLFITLTSIASNAISATPNTKTYKGNYFTIKYPHNFKPYPLKPRLRIDVNLRTHKSPPKYYYFIGTNEAYFTSPDKKVTFFVYSPLWGGDPENYLKIGPNEILVDEQKTKKPNTSPYDGKAYDRVVIRRVTIKSKDNSYYRSFVHSRKQNSDPTSWDATIDEVFGIKYKNKKAYDQYRDTYITFKKSLVKSAD